MKHDNETVEKVIQLKQLGFSSREIASIMNMSKSTVNDIYNRNNQVDEEFNMPSFESLTDGPRILVLDIETAAAEVLTFGRFKQNIGQANVLKEGGWILCASWKWLHDPDTTYEIHLSEYEIANADDSRIVCSLHDLYSEAHAIIAHNALGFDHKVIQTRAIANGLGALPSVKVIDTLVMAKKAMRLPSNRLDSIGEYFGLGRKIETGGITLWKQVQSGDPDAMRQMVTYCMQDVDLLYNVYMKLRAIGNAANFNAALYYKDDKVRCPTCGSEEVKPTGREVKTSVSSFVEYECNHCKSKHRHRVSTTLKEDRKKLLAPMR
jgi:transposase-like protein